MTKGKAPTSPKLSETMMSESRRLIGDPNIACVGIGLKIVKGKPTFEAAIQYHVRAKLGTEAEIRALGSEPVPVRIEGHKTDVLPWRMHRRAFGPDFSALSSARYTRKEDPLVGGTSTTVLAHEYSFPTTGGTLGGICFDVGTGDAMALSNEHVYGNQIGNDAIQPLLPTGEWLGAAVKYLFCGGPLSHVVFQTTPSPLTVYLTTAAIIACIIACGSDAEDPSRWGQRTGTVPPEGATTSHENVRIEAEVPKMPFPGVHWKTKTNWQYERVSTAGSSESSIAATRPNEHVIVGKRVFTDRDVYHKPDQVRLCAQVWTSLEAKPVEQFVVALLFPLSDPTRVVKRVLSFGEFCSATDASLDEKREPHCLLGVKPQVPGVDQMVLPVIEPPFILYSPAKSTSLLQPSTPPNPTSMTILRLPPKQSLSVVCPPSTHVKVEVYQQSGTIKASAFSANGTRIDGTKTAAGTGSVQKLHLSGPEIVRIVLEGTGYLVSLCADKKMLEISAGADRKWHSRYYTGALQLGKADPSGKWGVMVIAQSLDDTPVDGDPLDAARRISGIVDSANLVPTGECACTILYDHVFEVV